MVAVGSFFSVFFGKMIFGGLGRNLFNPAIVGYLFLIITFPVELTTQYIVPGSDLFTSATLLRDRAFGFSLTNVTDILLGEYAGTIGNTFKLGVLILGLGLVDPVSAPFTNRGKLIYGIGIAFITVIIRGLAAFPEGFIFAIIIMNAIAPMIDSMKWVQPKEVKA
jgi:Na+-translocating ferredoxin:NAD+ oxidoreductase RnfD subunit